jgi:hypothetical protein
LISARFFFPRILLTAPKASLGANTKDRLEAYATLHSLFGLRGYEALNFSDHLPFSPLNPTPNDDEALISDSAAIVVGQEQVISWITPCAMKNCGIACCAAKASTIASPMPVAPPLMRTTRSDDLNLACGRTAR